MFRGVIGKLARLTVCGTNSLSAPTASVTPTRGTCVFRRMYAPIPSRPGQRPRGLRKRHFVYILEENRSTKPAGDMQLLLVEDVEGIGLKGDVVTVSKRVGRLKLLPSNVATYPTSENVARVQEELLAEGERPRQSIWAQKTVEYLKNCHLHIPMSEKVEWTLDTSHVRIAFRQRGVELCDQCISLPEEPITSTGEFTINVTVNGITTVPVKTSVVYHSKSTRLQSTGHGLT